MACELPANCDLIFGILSCNLPEDTVDVDLKVCTLWWIHTYKKDRSTEVSKCIPWRTEVKPFPSLLKKMAENFRCRQIITTPFANRSFKLRPKATPARQSNLVTLTRPNREKLFQPRKVNIGTLPGTTQKNWLATLKAKKAEATASNQVPTPTQTSEALAAQLPTSPLSPDSNLQSSLL